MRYRAFGRTGWQVSEVSFGAWAIGGSWGTVTDEDAEQALERAIDRGVNFVDTADVYGDGRSETIVGRVLARRSERVYVATKAGRRLQPHAADGYTRANLERFATRSLDNLGTGVIDVLQLHCPPTAVYHRHDVFESLDSLVRAGMILHYGVSVETVDEALHAMRTYPGLQSVQIVFNAFRAKPADGFLDAARARDVAVIARVPLASGLLTGKLSHASTFAPDDHRTFNRHGEAFDVGETFAGVPFDVGISAVDRLRPLVPAGISIAQFALRWVLDHDGVTCVIPGAKSAAQVDDNVAASDLGALDANAHAGVQRVYDELVRPHVHGRW